jgi:hypothetical protein
MENQVDVQTESSPVIEVSRDGAAYAEWRQTGKLPEAKPAQPKEESVPSKESSAEGQEPKGKSAPAGLSAQTSPPFATHARRTSRAFGSGSTSDGTQRSRSGFFLDLNTHRF